MKKLALAIVFFTAFSCQKEPEVCQPNPNWLTNIVNVFDETNGKIESVYSYQYQRKLVYLIKYEEKCCDFYSSQLFDEQGNSLCFPTGGISGKGDKKCDGFDQNKSNEKLIWAKGSFQ